MFSQFQDSQKLSFDDSAQRQLNNLRKQTCTVSCEFAKTVNSFVSERPLQLKCVFHLFPSLVLRQNFGAGWVGF